MLYPAIGLPRFFGGCVGYMAYDMVRYFEKLPQTAEDELSLYDSYFMITDTVIVFDNLRQVIKVVSNVFVDPKKSKKQLYEEGLHKIEKLVKKLQGPLASIDMKPMRGNASNGSELELKANHTEEEFSELVERTKQYIEAGDVFQTVISTWFEAQGMLKALKMVTQ